MHRVSLAIQAIEPDGFRLGNPYALTVKRSDLYDVLREQGIPGPTAESIVTSHDRDGRTYGQYGRTIVTTF